MADATRRAPGARAGTLTGEGTPDVPVVVGADGRGYLFGTDLPALPRDRTYQLWAVDGPAPVSLAVLGPDPGVVAFSAGDAAALAITNEPAPGAVAYNTPLS